MGQQLLHTITQQIDYLTTEIKKNKKDSNPKFPQSYSTPHFQPNSLPVEYEEKIQPMSLLGRINQALDKINENIPSTSKLNTIKKDKPKSESTNDPNNSSERQNQKIITNKKYTKHECSENHSNNNYHQNKSKSVTCYKCNKPGHTSNRCRLKRKNKINKTIDLSLIHI